jgi:hypothetical protein
MHGALRRPAVLSITPIIKITSSIRNSPPELRSSPQALGRSGVECEPQSTQAIAYGGSRDYDETTAYSTLYAVSL